jgi:hypothetical protein
MDLQFKLDKNIKLISELSKFVFNIHREKDPQVFGEYDYLLITKLSRNGGAA